MWTSPAQLSDVRKLAERYHNKTCTLPPADVLSSVVELVYQIMAKKQVLKGPVQVHVSNQDACNLDSEATADLRRTRRLHLDHVFHTRRRFVRGRTLQA